MLISACSIRTNVQTAEAYRGVERYRMIQNECLLVRASSGGLVVTPEGDTQILDNDAGSEGLFKEGNSSAINEPLGIWLRNVWLALRIGKTAKA
jgi:hypothetical protein